MGVAGCALTIPVCAPAGVASCAPAPRPNWVSAPSIVTTRTSIRTAHLFKRSFMESSSVDSTIRREVLREGPEGLSIAHAEGGSLTADCEPTGAGYSRTPGCQAERAAVPVPEVAVTLGAGTP